MVLVFRIKPDIMYYAFYSNQGSDWYARGCTVLALYIHAVTDLPKLWENCLKYPENNDSVCLC